MCKNAFVLRNSQKIPAIGFGTYRIRPQDAAQAVHNAIQAGYRSIDCAARYGNEVEIGEAIESSGVPRKELFITSKLWNDDKGYDSTMKAFYKTLRNLRLEYLDLYLIHWPVARASKDRWQEANDETWRAFEELYSAGKIKAIGVSNFLPHHLKPLMAHAHILPMIDQLEFHPGMCQPEAVSFCRENGVFVEAWAPFSNGQMLALPELQVIALKYDKSAAQICLRWILQKGIAPVAKSLSTGHALENLEVFDFELLPADVAKIDTLPKCGDSGFNPDNLDF